MKRFSDGNGGIDGGRKNCTDWFAMCGAPAAEPGLVRPRQISHAENLQAGPDECGAESGDVSGIFSFLAEENSVEEDSDWFLTSEPSRSVCSASDKNHHTSASASASATLQHRQIFNTHSAQWKRQINSSTD